MTRDIDIGILFIRPFVCPSRSGIVPKRLNVLSQKTHNLFTTRYSNHSSFTIKHLRKISTRSPPCGGGEIQVGSKNFAIFDQ